MHKSVGEKYLYSLTTMHKIRIEKSLCKKMLSGLKGSSVVKMKATSAVVLLKCLQVIFQTGDNGVLCMDGKQECICFPSEEPMRKICVPAQKSCEDLRKRSSGFKNGEESF